MGSRKKGLMGKCLSTKENKLMFFLLLKFGAVLLTTKPRRGGGLKALVVCPLKKKFVFLS